MVVVKLELDVGPRKTHELLKGQDKGHACEHALGAHAEWHAIYDHGLQTPSSQGLGEAGAAWKGILKNLI